MILINYININININISHLKTNITTGNKFSGQKPEEDDFSTTTSFILRMLLSSMITKPSNKNLVLTSCSLRTTVLNNL